jgi:hypothetical protein
MAHYSIQKSLGKTAPSLAGRRLSCPNITLPKTRCMLYAKFTLKQTVLTNPQWITCRERAVFYPTFSTQPMPIEVSFWPCTGLPPRSFAFKPVTRFGLIAAGRFRDWFLPGLRTKSLSPRPDVGSLSSLRLRPRVFSNLADVTPTSKPATQKSVSTRNLYLADRVRPGSRNDRKT